MWTTQTTEVQEVLIDDSSCDGSAEEVIPNKDNQLLQIQIIKPEQPQRRVSFLNFHQNFVRIPHASMVVNEMAARKLLFERWQFVFRETLARLKFNE